MLYYKKYKKYKLKYLKLLLGGYSSITSLNKAKNLIKDLLNKDKTEGKKQLKRGDIRSMESNNKYLIFFTNYLWISRNQFLRKFARKILNIESINITWLEKTIDEINGLSINKWISLPVGDSLTRQLSTSLNLETKETIYLNLLKLLYKKTFEEINTEQEMRMEEERESKKREEERKDAEYEILESHDLPKSYDLTEDDDENEYEFV